MRKYKNEIAFAAIMSVLFLFYLGLLFTGFGTKDAFAKKGEGVIYELYSGVTNHSVTDPSGYTNRSLYDILQTIGTSKKATVKLKNDNESGTTTPYKFTTAGNFSSYSNVYFEIEPGAQIEVGAGSSGVTLPSPSNIKAQPNQQWVSGTSIYFSKAGTVFPAWFGAAGDGTTDDSIAWQTSADSLVSGGAINGAGLAFKINAQRAQWTALDLHHLGIASGTSTFTSGYYYGVKFRSDTSVDNAIFVLYSAGYSTTKNPFALAFGDPTSGTTNTNSSVRHCSFKWLSGDAGTVDVNPVLLQTATNFRFTDNLVDGTLSPQNISFSYAFDVADLYWQRNTYINTKGSLSPQFAKRVSYMDNKHFDCRYVVDADKRVQDLKIIGNSYDRTTQDSSGDDYIFELNGTQDAILEGNRVNYAYRYLGLSHKADVYTTWAEVVAQSGVSSMTRWSNIVSRGNVLTNLSFQGVIAGTNWTSVPHNGTQCGEDLTIEDQFYNCCEDCASGSVGTITIYEGRRIKINSTIKGGDACGIYARSYIDSDAAGATTYSDLEIEIGGQIEDTLYEGISLYRMGKAHLKSPVLLRCGETSNRQIILNDMNSRNAVITGSVRVEEDGGTIAYGVRITDTTWTTGNWLIKLDNVYIVDHTTDVYLTDASGTTNVWLTGYMKTMAANTFNTAGQRAFQTDPSGVTNPRFVGEIIQVSGVSFYIATGTNKTNWQVISGK